MNELTWIKNTFLLSCKLYLNTTEFFATIELINRMAGN